METGKALCLLENAGCRVRTVFLAGWALAGLPIERIRQDMRCTYARFRSERAGGWYPTVAVSRQHGRGRNDELLYQTLDNQIMAVLYTVEGDLFRGEVPRLWTERRILRRPRSSVHWTFIRTASEWPPPWRPKVRPRIGRTRSSSSSTSSTSCAGSHRPCGEHAEDRGSRDMRGYIRRPLQSPATPFLAFRELLPECSV